MRKSLSLILCLALSLALFAGCSDEDAAKTTGSTRAAETTATTKVPEETTVPETTEATEAELNTVVLRSSDRSLRLNYVLMAVNEDAPFIAQGVDLNEQGADALIQWLMAEDARKAAAEFGEDEFGESVFLISGDEARYTGRISKAAANTATIRLALDETLAASGLLEALLPLFEEAYGYTVEITEYTGLAVFSAARNGYADLVLAEAGDWAQALADDGFARTVTGFESEQITFAGMQHLLCGPADDPAGAADCYSVTDAFAAIAEGEYTFLSRGDGSTVHKLEQRFWDEDLTFGDWYISADMEMGPCLVMNDMEGGYILTDKLTWLMYFHENGIV